MGAALGLLLVFRNNSAYEKWWEARKEIGNLVNTSRNLAITINGLLPSDAKEKNALYLKLDAFIFTLKDHLRDKVDPTHYSKLSIEDQRTINQAKHKPNVIINLMMEKIEFLYLDKKISDIQQSVLIEKMHALIDILGRCERIKYTPIPINHQILLRFLINIYVVILPFSLVDDLGFLCLPMILFLYYILMSIVTTAEEIEDPFGNDLNDLKMDAIINNIHQNIHELIHFE
jgi:putative membrane protein